MSTSLLTQEILPMGNDFVISFVKGFLSIPHLLLKTNGGNYTYDICIAKNIGRNVQKYNRL